MGQKVKTASAMRPTEPAGAGTLAIQELAVSAMRGSESAFADLHRVLTAPFIGFFMKRVGGDARTAEELAHDAVSEALQSLASGRYDPKRAWFLTFVYGVSHKVRLRHIKQKAKGRERRLSELAEGDAERMTERFEAGGELSPPLDQIEAMRSCLHAEGTSYSLTAEERFVVAGRAEQKTFELLAKELGRSLDTVYRRMVRGLEKLRKCMEGKGHR